MRKNKRLLSVHPLDFDPEEYFPHSRRQSVQVWPHCEFLSVNMGFPLSATPCFPQQQLQEERAYRQELEYEAYQQQQRANRRRSLDRYAMRAGNAPEWSL